MMESRAYDRLIPGEVGKLVQAIGQGTDFDNFAIGNFSDIDFQKNL
jgi:hypothetical protein